MEELFEIRHDFSRSKEEAMSSNDTSH